jgi:hypothetical protein
MKSNNNNNNNNNDDDDDDDEVDDNNNNNTEMVSVHARGDTFLTFGLKALTETNTSRLATSADCGSLLHTLRLTDSRNLLRNKHLVSTGK